VTRNLMFLQGNNAVSEGALYAGCRFFAGYPITPSSEVAEHLSRSLPRHGGRFIQMEDEIAAMAAVVGASIAGKKSLTATSGPGFSLKQENLGYACITETPVVVLNVSRGGPSTGMPTGPSQSDVMQAKWGTHGDHPIIVLTPSTVQEQFVETVRAFNLSEKYRVPVIILTDEIIAHMREAIEIPEPGELEIINRVKPSCSPEEFLPFDDSKGDIPPMASFGEGYRFHITGLNYDATGFPTNNGQIVQKCEERLMRKISDNYDDIVKCEEFMCEDADILVFAFGGTARSAKDAIINARKDGIKVGLLKPLTIWPFPEKELLRCSSGVKKIIVPELNLGQIIYEVKRVVKDNDNIVGINRVDAEPINPVQIYDEIRG